MKASLFLLFLLFAIGYSTPLDDYVNKPDPTYKYEDLGDPDHEDGFTAYYINLTSQTWLSSTIKCVYKYFSCYIIENDVDRSVWWHYLVIFVPEKVVITDTAFIYVTGGSNTNTKYYI